VSGKSHFKSHKKRVSEWNSATSDFHAAALVYIILKIVGRQTDWKKKVTVCSYKRIVMCPYRVLYKEFRDALAFSSDLFQKRVQRGYCMICFCTHHVCVCVCVDDPLFICKWYECVREDLKWSFAPETKGRDRKKSHVNKFLYDFPILVR